jgi:hypothetical protein
MLKKCTPLWREAHFEVKMYKTHHVQTTFGSWDVEKAHAVVAWSTFRSQNVQNTPRSDHFWKLRCRKVREAHFKVKMFKTPHARTAFEGSDVVLRGRRKGFCTLPKVCKTWGFVAFPKTMAGVGDLQRICKDAFRVAGAVQETCSSDFLRGAAFWSIRSVGLLRCFCVAGAALRMTWHQFFVVGAILYLDRWSGKS